MTVRVRYAPSPTGYLHIGGLRTVLYNYLLAKKNQGTFFLRIEDTDQKRFNPGSAEDLIKSILEMGLTYDEGPTLPENGEISTDPSLKNLGEKGNFGPYIQSHRSQIYKDHLKILLENNSAYYCFCTPQTLQKMREEQKIAKISPMYDRRCQKLAPEQITENLSQNLPFVIRQKIDRNRKIEFKDLIRGKISFHCSELDDQILMKSDGLPTYHLAHVIDDYLMQTTHVLRGEEWLASTPKHLLLFEAFNWPAPSYAHLPLITNADKTKLSKRQNDVSVKSYIEQGYLKEAIINFIVLLGWNPGKGSEQEIFSLEELSQTFDLAQINKAGAIFNRAKLDWFNFKWHKRLLHNYLKTQALSIDPNCNITTKKDTFDYQFQNQEHQNKFDQLRAEYLKNLIIKQINPDFTTETQKLNRALLSIEEKILTSPNQINEHLFYLFNPNSLNPELLLNPKMGIESLSEAQKALTFSQTLLTELKTINPEPNLSEIRDQFLTAIKTENLKNGQILWPLRAALTHEQFSIGAFEAIWVLGLNRSLELINEALAQK